MKRKRLMFLTSVAMVGVLAGTASAYSPATVEATYQANGPSSVATFTSTAACDREGKLCDVYYPANLASLPGKLPVVAWANGSGVNTTAYDYFLRHLASWGFLVVASRDTDTGAGTTTIDAANWLIAQGNTSTSLFYNKVDGTKVGAAGHSQGGSSVMRLFQDKQAPFTVFVPIHMSPNWFASWCCGVSKTKVAQVNQGSIFWHQSTPNGGYAETKAMYDSITSTNVTKAIGVLAQAGHNDISGHPDCAGIGDCITGVYGYLGYSTLWFLWKLKGNAQGPTTFGVGDEFLSSDPDWDARFSNVP